MVLHRVAPLRPRSPIAVAGSGAIQAAAFALNAGSVVDAKTLIHVDPEVRDERRLLLCVEPLEPSARGIELATLALVSLRETFAAATDLPPTAALMKAFTAANAVLVNENRPLAGCRWERRVYVGATAIVLAGCELIIAQIPPTQAMIIQDQRIYAFPDLVTWRHDYMPASDEPEPDPLGCREGTRPLLFRSLAASGDLVVLCATAIARHLGRDSGAALAPLAAGDPDAALSYLGDTATRLELDDVHAAVIQLRRVSSRGGRLRLALPRWGQPRTTWPAATPQLPSTGRLGQIARSEPGGLSPSQPLPALRPNWNRVGVPLDRPLGSPTAHASSPSWRSTASPAEPARPRRFGWLQHGVARLAKQFARTPEPAAIQFAARRRALAAPGAGSVHRYREQASIPVEWRANLPRGPEVHLPTRLLTVGFVLFLAFGGSGAMLDRYRGQVARADAALAVVDGSLQTLAADPAAADEALLAAETALAEARAAGADPATIHQRAYAVEAARDQAWGNLRLTDLTRLGALPAPLLGQPVQLARTGHDVWLVGGGLYGLDPAQNRLVQVLAPGTAVQGGAVGTLQSVAADGGRMVVADADALYARDDTGRWRRQFLDIDEGEPTLLNIPVATYQGSLYSLASGGRLLKYRADSLTEAPQLWASAEDYPDLLSGKDLVIDGRIHVLLSDGRVLTLFRGRLDTIVTPDIVPALVAPTHLIGGPDTTYLYMVDVGAEVGLTTGRIIRLDQAGNTRQILPPLPIWGDPASDDAARILGEAHDFVIDEEAGLIYFVTDSELWRASLPR